MESGAQFSTFCVKNKVSRHHREKLIATNAPSAQILVADIE